MFGYLKLDKNCPNNIKKEYKKYYCFLCRSLQKHYGLLPRFILSYDVAFFLLFVADENEFKSIDKVPCYGGETRLKGALNLDVSQQIAALNILLMAQKIKDNVLDENDLKARVASFIYKHSIERAMVRNPIMSNIMDSEYGVLREIENTTGDLKSLEDVFSRMMVRLASECFNVSDRHKLDSLKTVSKWLYCIDAVDDLDEDIKKSTFNPFSQYRSFYALKNTNYKYLFDHFHELYTDAGIPNSKLMNDVILNRLLFYGIPSVTTTVLTKRRK